jgi:energy-converting hydrogenase A subunit R
MEFDGLEEMMPFDGKIFVTDCEGPITKNDIAYELCSEFIENGEKLFSILTQYDDILANIFKKDGYKSGDKIRLILPFLKAYGATDTGLVEYSRNHLQLIDGADKTMRYVQEIMSPFMVSSSYEHYVSAVCDLVGFPFDNVFCTKVSLDTVRMDTWESDTLKHMAQDIVKMPAIEVSRTARGVRDLSQDARRTVQRLDQMFWNEMTDMQSYQLMMDTQTIGDEEKASSVVEVCKKMGVPLEDCMYVGDSSTDARALHLVRKGGGLAISFNGSRQAVRESDIAIMSTNTIVTSILAEAFYRTGRDAVLDLVENWSLEGLRSSGMVHEYLQRELIRVYPDELPRVRRVSPSDLNEIAEQSSRFRKGLKGDPVGNLG